MNRMTHQTSNNNINTANDWIVEVTEDIYNLYGKGTRLSLNTLIKKYLEGLDEEEDSLPIQALTMWQNSGKLYNCMVYIASVWEITLVHIEN